MTREARQHLLSTWLSRPVAVVVACFGIDADIRLAARRERDRLRKRRSRARVAAIRTFVLGEAVHAG